MGFVVERKRLCFDEEVAGLYRLVLSSLERKEFLALDPEYVPECDGLLYLCRNAADRRLAGTFTLAFPGPGCDNLGRDIGFDGQKLLLTAHMDIAVVHPEFRGNGIQKLLMTLAGIDAAALGYRYLMCTVHPENTASMRSALSLGYEVVAMKEKYGGYERAVLLKTV